VHSNFFGRSAGPAGENQQVIPALIRAQLVKLGVEATKACREVVVSSALAAVASQRAA
jgi:hypothetical protein